MMISVLIPTFRRPHMLARALESLARQSTSQIGEVLVGDDSPPEARVANLQAIAQSEIAARVRHFAHDPPLGNYPTQYALAERAQGDHLLVLNDDDELCPGGLDLLAKHRLGETDERVAIWFGKEEILQPDGSVDLARTREHLERFGKTGPACAKSVSEWLSTQSIPPDLGLVERARYLALMQGDRDPDGDWHLHSRLAAAGAWGRYVGEFVCRYRT